MNKSFLKEIEKIFDKIVNNENFSIARYGDGEWMAMSKQTGTSGNNEWVIGDNTNVYDFPRQKLWEAFKFQDENYFIGIPCPCCQGSKFYEIKDASQQREENLTYANIFVNSNYLYFVEKFIPEFNKKNNIHLIANKVTDPNNLPFKIENFYPVEYNAWIYNYDLIEKIKEQNLNNKIFLFSAGSFSKIACYELWKNNKNNIYIDVGSTLDPWTKANRLYGKYYTPGSPDIKKICHWG